MLYAPYNIQLMRPIFHLHGHIALKFNSIPVCFSKNTAFLKTLDIGRDFTSSVFIILELSFIPTCIARFLPLDMTR